ncbi:Fe-S cluster assembly ATPase SufC [Candidatus Saccharibacteria bacterium]|nr:Fe-S cluster assembly ATPase SufC [Candidatus Saccharibacteria bacterium]
MKLLEVRGVKLAVDGREILHGIDFEMEQGETVVVLGKNGAGKSSLAGVVMGIFGEDKNREKVVGKVIFNGKDMSKKSLDARAREGIFMSFQAPVEISGVNMMEMLWSALEERGRKALARREVEEKIAEAVRELGVDAFTAGREVNVGASGGERKKNEILQMMVLEPKLAILDEIDSGLDVDAAGKMSEVLAKYQEKTGVGYMIITHNMRILEKMKVDKVYVFDNGRVKRIGGREIIKEVEKVGFLK